MEELRQRRFEELDEDQGPASRRWVLIGTVVALVLVNLVAWLLYG